MHPSSTNYANNFTDLTTRWNFHSFVSKQQLIPPVTDAPRNHIAIFPHISIVLKFELLSHSQRRYNDKLIQMQLKIHEQCWRTTPFNFSFKIK